MHVTALTSRLNVLSFEDTAARAALLAEIAGGPVPESVTVFPPFYTDHGLGVMIGPKVDLVTSGHPLDPTERREYITPAPIVMEKNAWIEAAATALPGVTVGHDAVVGAGAVVTRDVPPHSLVTGPAADERKRWAS